MLISPFEQPVGDIKSAALCRGILSSEYIVQSIIGFAFPEGHTFLLSPLDSHVATQITSFVDKDQWGNQIQVGAHHVFIGRFLAAVYPTKEDYQVFRLHIDRYLVYRDQPVCGELLGGWGRYHQFSGGNVHYRIGWESLWGNPYADTQRIFECLQRGEIGPLIYRTPFRVALSREEIMAAHTGFLPHPNTSPSFESDEDLFIFQQERKIEEAKRRARESQLRVQ